MWLSGIVFVTSGFRGNALLAISLADAKEDITDSGAIAWSHDRDTPYVPSPLLYDDTLYFLKHNSGLLSSFDAKTGEVNYQMLCRLDWTSSLVHDRLPCRGRLLSCVLRVVEGSLHDGGSHQLALFHPDLEICTRRTLLRWKVGQANHLTQRVAESNACNSPSDLIFSNDQMAVLGPRAGVVLG